MIFNMLSITRSDVRHVIAFCASKEFSFQMLHSLVIFKIFHVQCDIRTRRAMIFDWTVPVFALKITIKHIPATYGLYVS